MSRCTPWRINMEPESDLFLFNWVILRFQPFIFRGVSLTSKKMGENFQLFSPPCYVFCTVSLSLNFSGSNFRRRRRLAMGTPNFCRNGNGSKNSQTNMQTLGAKTRGFMWNKWFCSSFPNLNVIVAALCMCHVLSRYLAILHVSFPSGCIFTRSISHLGTGQLFGCVIVGFDFLSQWCPIYFLFALHKDASHLGFSWYKQLISDECSHIFSWYKQ